VHKIRRLGQLRQDKETIRTSDFANWELKHDPKQGLARFIYDGYREKQDVRPLDIFVVRDGTWLVGSSTIVTEGDEEIVFCGGLVKLRTLDEDALPPYLLLALLNTYVVKRQMRSKQFTRDVIDTLGRRLDEVRLPVPRSAELRQRIDEFDCHDGSETHTFSIQKKSQRPGTL